MKGKTLRWEHTWLALALVVWFFLSSIPRIRPGAVANFETGPSADARDTFAGPSAGEHVDAVRSVSATIRGLFQRKNLDPSDFFAHWADNSDHWVLADFNNDGQLDAAFSGRLSSHQSKIEIWQGDGAGWHDPVLLEVEGVPSDSHLTLCDLNHDGFVDLVTTEPFSHVMIDAWLGSATGTFTRCQDIPYRLWAHRAAQWMAGSFSGLAINLPNRLKYICPLSVIPTYLRWDFRRGLLFKSPAGVLSRFLDLRTLGRSPPLS